MNNGLKPDIQPTILQNQNVDASLIEELASASLQGDPKEINFRLEAGFQVIRIQTEITSYGHDTIVYLARLKKKE